MKYYIKTFGCQMNHSDSERIAGFLEMHKIKPAKDINQAGLAVFNTCGVRQMAEDRVYGQIHNLRKKHPKIKIVLTGCLANRKDVQRRLKNKVDLFCEINNFHKEIEPLLIRHLERLKNAVILSLSGAKSEGSSKKYRLCTQEVDSSSRPPVSPQNDDRYLLIKPKYTNANTAFVPIMTGCNNFCSYCVVPYARGREVSRPTEEIITEIKSLVKNGCKEIILLGQNVNSYRFIDKNSSADEADKNKKVVTFPILLGKINSIPGNFWIWFVSNHPKDFSNELIETMTKCQKVCECVHLPIQAGDDKILESMNRKYTTREYLAKIDKIKKAFAKNKPDKLYSITSDIIVGFPGETKKQFLESAKIMKKVSYDMVYFGQFSPRPGTAAYIMKDNVKKSEKARREKYLNEILKKTAHKNNKKYVGKIMEVLVDKKVNSDYFGHTRTMKNVKITSAKKNIAGKIVMIRITKASAWNLEGVLKI